MHGGASVGCPECAGTIGRQYQPRVVGRLVAMRAATALARSLGGGMLELSAARPTRLSAPGGGLAEHQPGPSGLAWLHDSVSSCQAAFANAVITGCHQCPGSGSAGVSPASGYRTAVAICYRDTTYSTNDGLMRRTNIAGAVLG